MVFNLIIVPSHGACVMDIHPLQQCMATYSPSPTMGVTKLYSKPWSTNNTMPTCTRVSRCFSLVVGGVPLHMESSSLSKIYCYPFRTCHPIHNNLSRCNAILAYKTRMPIKCLSRWKLSSWCGSFIYLFCGAQIERKM